jgi:hypothetical protein
MTFPPPCMRSYIGSPYHPLDRLCKAEHIRTTGCSSDDLTLAFSLLVLLVIYGRTFSMHWDTPMKMMQGASDAAS